MFYDFRDNLSSRGIMQFREDQESKLIEYKVNRTDKKQGIEANFKPKTFGKT